MEEREQRDREMEAQKQQREETEREEARRKETTHSTEEGVAKKYPRNERSDTKIDREGGGETGTFQSQSRQEGAYDEHLFNRLR